MQRRTRVPEMKLQMMINLNQSWKLDCWGWIWWQCQLRSCSADRRPDRGRGCSRQHWWGRLLWGRWGRLWARWRSWKQVGLELKRVFLVLWQWLERTPPTVLQFLPFLNERSTNVGVKTVKKFVAQKRNINRTTENVYIGTRLAVMRALILNFKWKM